MGNSTQDNSETLWSERAQNLLALKPFSHSAQITPRPQPKLTSIYLLHTGNEENVMKWVRKAEKDEVQTVKSKLILHVSRVSCHIILYMTHSPATTRTDYLQYNINEERFYLTLQLYQTWHPPATLLGTPRSDWVGPVASSTAVALPDTDSRSTPRRFWSILIR